jgi:DNA invertase Pin-like site-specific DNA recombinase
MSMADEQPPDPQGAAKTVAAYLRVSAICSSDSSKGQLGRIKEYAASQGCRVAIIFEDITR